MCSNKINNGAEACPSFPIYEDEIKPILFEVFNKTRIDVEDLLLRRGTDDFKENIPMINNRDYEIIKDDLKRLGLRRGDAVLMHSSYKSLGGLCGGIETLISAILSTIGDTGTLIVPTLSYAFVTAESPVFDHALTPSCVGAVSEYVRRLDGARRSIHPTHSCAAIGYKQDYYIDGHELDRTPVGENSPFYKLSEDGGKLLMLGCGIAPNTSMHGVEERFGAWYLLTEKPSPYTVIAGGESYTIPFRRHNILQNGFVQCYKRLEEVLDARYMPSAEVHGATSYLIDSHEMWRAGLDALRRDELFFVKRCETR